MGLSLETAVTPTGLLSRDGSGANMDLISVATVAQFVELREMRRFLDDPPPEDSRT